MEAVQILILPAVQILTAVPTPTQVRLSAKEIVFTKITSPTHVTMLVLPTHTVRIQIILSSRIVVREIKHVKMEAAVEQIVYIIHISNA